MDDLRRVRDALLEAHHVALTTHVNADGDGAGCEVALARWLDDHGVSPVIVNPTPFPDAYSFLLDDRGALTAGDGDGRRALERADLVAVLDTSEPSRLGNVGPFLGRARVAVVDHHPASPDSVGDVVARDPSACATGELVWDLLRLDDGGIDAAQARALYVAVVTDTGSFRFGNTTARSHEIAASLIRDGVDVEAMFRRLFARYTPEALDLLRRALSTLEVAEEGRLAWLTLRREDLEDTGATAEDREGLVEYARRLRGVEVALLFRELPDGRCKVSLRSNGDVDVSAVAQAMGGGGHRQAAGLLLDASLASARDRVLARVRRAVAELRRVLRSGGHVLV
ncbi:MAG: DHH family phosphoesterase, partial [Gemmatimonadota bacterium]